MRHYNEKKKAEIERRRLRKLKRDTLTALAAAVSSCSLVLLIGWGCQPPAEVKPTTAECVEARRTGYHYGVNDACYHPAITAACERVLSQAYGPAQERAARDFCGIR